MSDNITVIRESERPVVDFVGGATYRTIVGDDNGAGVAGGAFKTDRTGACTFN